MKNSIEVNKLLTKAANDIHALTGLYVWVTVFPFVLDNVHPDKIVDIVSVELGVSLDEIKSTSKRREFVDARFIIISVLNSIYPNLTHGRLASMIGRDRSTVSESLNTVNDYLKANKYFIDKYDRCMKAILNQLEVIQNEN